MSLGGPGWFRESGLCEEEDEGRAAPSPRGNLILQEGLGLGMGRQMGERQQHCSGWVHSQSRQWTSPPSLPSQRGKEGAVGAGFSPLITSSSQKTVRTMEEGLGAGLTQATPALPEPPGDSGAGLPPAGHSR